MRTFEIPREAWIEQLNAFTIAHDGWLASVDVIGPRAVAQTEFKNLPLLGVSAERIDHDGTIAISVAHSAADHFTHIVVGGAHIFIERVMNGSTAALVIGSVDGTKTILKLRAPTSRRPDASDTNPAEPHIVSG